MPEKNTPLPIFQQLGIKLKKGDVEELEKVLPRLEEHARSTMAEVEKIELTVEEHVREMGITLSGIVSFLGKGRWENKFKAKHGEDGEKAFEELWWVKKKLKFHAPIALRSESVDAESKFMRTMLARTRERHWNWPSGKPVLGKWDDDNHVSTEEGSEEEQKWKEHAKKFWGGKDITAKSAYLQKLGKDLVVKIEQDSHVLGKLFRIVHVDGDTQAKLSSTADIKDVNDKAISGKGLKTDGILKDEIEDLLKLKKILCKKGGGGGFPPPPPPTDKYLTISGKVVDAKDHDKPVPLADVWLEFFEDAEGTKPVKYGGRALTHVQAAGLTTNDAGGGFMFSFSIDPIDPNWYVEIRAKKDGRVGTHIADGGKPIGRFQLNKRKDSVWGAVVPIDIAGPPPIPLSVKIDTPEEKKVFKSQVPDIISSKEDFRASIIGGVAPYSFVWHWGLNQGQQSTSDPAPGNILILNNEKEVWRHTGKKGERNQAELNKGFRMLMEAARKAGKHPFNNTEYSIGSKGEDYLLHVTTRDGLGNLAHDKIVVRVVPDNRISGVVVEHADPSKHIPEAEVWLTHKETPEGKEIDYKSKGKKIVVTTDEHGYFSIEGIFQHSIKVHTKKGKGKGVHTLPPHGKPSTLFDMVDKGVVNDVVVPLWFEPPKTEIKDIPLPIDKKLHENVNKLNQIVQGKIGADNIPEGVRGIGNHAGIALKNMEDEIKKHLDEINDFRSRKNYTGPSRNDMYSLITKRSEPLGLDNFKKGKFFGFSPGDGGAKGLEIVHIEKFVFGSPRRLVVGYIGEGKAGKLFEGTGDALIKQKAYSFQTEGVGINFFLRNLYAGNIPALRQILVMIHEKIDLIDSYHAEAKKFEKVLAGHVDDALDIEDEKLATLLSNMQICFTNIREFFEKHDSVGSLKAIKDGLEPLFEFGEGSRDERVQEIFKHVYEWQHTNNERWNNQGPKLEQKFAEVVKEIQDYIKMLIGELNTAADTISRNYDNFKRDLEEFHKFQAQAIEVQKKVAGEHF